jgi:hypothetical protein
MCFYVWASKCIRNMCRNRYMRPQVVHTLPLHLLCGTHMLFVHAYKQAHINVYVCMDAYMHMFAHTLQTHVLVNPYTSSCLRMQTNREHRHRHIHASHMPVCMYVYIYIHVHAYTHTHTHTHIRTSAHTVAIYTLQASRIKRDNITPTRCCTGKSDLLRAEILRPGFVSGLSHAATVPGNRSRALPGARITQHLPHPRHEKHAIATIPEKHTLSTWRHLGCPLTSRTFSTHFGHPLTSRVWCPITAQAGTVIFFRWAHTGPGHSFILARAPSNNSTLRRSLCKRALFQAKTARISARHQTLIVHAYARSHKQSHSFCEIFSGFVCWE